VTRNVHPDDIAVDLFAAAMKRKLARKRAEGRCGWNDPDKCDVSFLADLLICWSATSRRAIPSTSPISP
jgi:hypothetical protein